MPTNRNFKKAAIWALEQEGKPMTVDLIVEKAIEAGELTTTGQTAPNSMRARISEDIRKKKIESLFIRIGPNKFGLRKWSLKEYDEHPLIKDPRGEFVVCIPQTTIDKFGRFFGYTKKVDKFLQLLQISPVNFIDRAKAEVNDENKQLISYVLLTNRKGEILSFKRGSYSTANKRLLEGAVCIGFGGHVNVLDYISNKGNYRLFAYRELGVKEAASREIREELRFSSFDEESLEFIGVINDDSSPTGLRHLGIVLKGVLPDSFNLENINAERSINKLRFLSPNDLWREFYELEFWSQLVCKAYWKRPAQSSQVKISAGKKKIIDGPISIVGEIATGKTIISSYLAKRYKLPVVTTRLCVAELIGVKDFKSGKRDDFSQRAFKLVSTKKGIEKLAKKIISEIKKTGKNMVIVDGIRNLETNRLLERAFPNLTTIFVDCPRDDSYRYYRLRVKRNATIDEFRSARHHEVEREVFLFKNRAKLKIYNGGTKRELLSRVGAWFDEKIQISK
jgi:predicted NUDIX family phosphoesterase